jgi:uncharacterized membrane protein
MTALLIILVTGLALLLPALARPTLPFGVRVTQDRVADPAVVHARAIYLRLVLASALLAGALGVLFGSGPLWASLLAVVDFGLYLYANRTIRAVKRRDNWVAGRRQGVTTDTTFRTDPVRLPWPHLLPAVVIAAVTAILGFLRYGDLPAAMPDLLGFGVDQDTLVPTTWPHAFEPVLLQAGTTLLVPLVALLVVRARPDLDAARPKGSARRYRVYLRGIALMTFVLAAAVNLALAITALQLWDVVPATAAWRIVSYLPLALMVVALVVWDRKVGSAGHRLPAEPGEDEEESPVIQRDDDDNWYLGGLVYVNRTDSAAFVHARIGHSWTICVMASLRSATRRP